MSAEVLRTRAAAAFAAGDVVKARRLRECADVWDTVEVDAIHAYRQELARLG